MGHKQRLEELRVEAATRPCLEERRNRLARSLADPIFAERTGWDRERTWMQGQQDWVWAILDSLPESIPARSELPIDIEDSTVKAILEKVREVSDQILETGRNDLDGFRKTLTGAVSELESYRSRMEHSI